MAKRQQTGLPNRLAGKKLVFSGKFDYGVEDSLKAMAEGQQGTVKADLDAKIDYLVLADLSAGKTIQKKALSLNGKGAAIQVIDTDAFKKLAEPAAEEILAVLRAGASEVYAKLWQRPMYYVQSRPTRHSYRNEDLSATKLNHFDLTEVRFEDCNFVGSKLDEALFGVATGCDFSKVVAESSEFGDVSGSRFRLGTLNGCKFVGALSGADFSSAALKEALFADFDHYQSRRKPAHQNVTFTKANLNSASFHNLHLTSPRFDGADLTRASFEECIINSGNFRKAKLQDAVLVGCKLLNSDLTNADLTNANLGEADLTGVILEGANLKNASLRGAKLNGVDLSKAKNYDPGGAKSGSAGPALAELDSVNSKARRIEVKFRLSSSSGNGNEGEEVVIDSSGLKYGGGIQAPMQIASRRSPRRGQARSFSDAMLQLANSAGNLKVRFETVDVSSTKSPKEGKELRELVMRGIAEAFGQELPAAAKLAAATKKYRQDERKKGAAEREREKEKAEAARQKEKAKKQIAKKIEKAVGKVSDVASFLKALEVRIEKPKIDKATKMLKASGFKLFNDITDQHVSGVVKSQTDADLVYACRVAHDGQYACCTQNLNVCGGLRGSICKHLLVLIIGLVQAGELDPTTIDGWIAKTHSTKPELDKETMGAIFIKYKGAEAGEVDWRPTETVPEDYYAL